MKQTAIRRSNFKICKLYGKLRRLTKETPIYQFTFHHTLGYTCRRLRQRYLFLDETQNYYLGKKPHIQVWSSVVRQRHMTAYFKFLNNCKQFKDFKRMYDMYIWYFFIYTCSDERGHMINVSLSDHAF